MTLVSTTLPHHRIVSWITRLKEKLARFFFPADSGLWLTFLRVGVGLQVLLFCLSLRKDWNDLFAQESSRFISRDLTEAVLTLQNPLVPRLGWLISLGDHFGLSEERALFLIWFCLLAAGCCLLLGFCCRTSAIIAWLLHLCAVKSGDFVAYGMDNFTTIGLFYLVVSPLPDRYAIDRKLWPAPNYHPGVVGLARRVLQLHVCFIYFFGGITKSLGAEWWTGESMWRALTRPPFNLLPVQLLASWSAVLFPLGIAVCLLETGYPFFIWWKKTRFAWFVSVLAMHVAIALTMGLYLFATIMIVLNVAAFGPGIFPSNDKRLILPAQGVRT